MIFQNTKKREKFKSIQRQETGSESEVETALDFSGENTGN